MGLAAAMVCTSWFCCFLRWMTLQLLRASLSTGHTCGPVLPGFSGAVATRREGDKESTSDRSGATLAEPERWQSLAWRMNCSQVAERPSGALLEADSGPHTGTQGQVSMDLRALFCAHLKRWPPMQASVHAKAAGISD